MPNGLRGLILAAFAATLPATAFADCPPEASVERYAQTARDALSALDGLVPESQQMSLERRYSAMLVLKWKWKGSDTLLADPSAVAHMAACVAAGPCEASTADLFSSNATRLPDAPSPQLLYWAQTELSCDLPLPEGLVIEVETPEPEPDTAPIETVAETPAPPESDPETILADTSEDATDLNAADTIDAVEATDTGSGSDTELAARAPEEETSTRTADLAAPDANAALQALTQSIQADAAAASATPFSDEDPAALVQTAAALFAAGRPSAAIEPLRTACFAEVETETNSQACNTLLDVYNAPTERNGSANTPNYLALSEELCAMSYNRGCQNLAQHYAGQNTVEAHLATVAFTERSCSLGDGEACATVADYYLTGRATEPNPELARERLEQSCELGRLSSCQDVADYYLRGVGGEVDIDKALAVNEASCPAGDAERPDICVAAADFVMIHMKASEDRSAKVRAFTQRACELGHDIGCAWFAEDLELGLGGEVDLLAAKDARLVACEYGHQASCDSRS